MIFQCVKIYVKNLTLLVVSFVYHTIPNNLRTKLNMKEVEINFLHYLKSSSK